MDYTLDYANASLEEMDWSDTCLDASNNSFMSPATFRGQSGLPAGNWKNKENTSPSSLLSSLNIAEFPRSHNMTLPFASPKKLQNSEISAAHHSTFQLTQSMLSSNLSVAKPKLPLVASGLSSASATLPSMTSKFDSFVTKSQTSSMHLPAFHRTLHQSCHSLKNSPTLDQDLSSSDFDQDVIFSALHKNWVPDSLGNEFVMKNKDESFQGNKVAEETDATDAVSSEEGDHFENKLQTVDLKKPKRSVCSCLFRMSCYSLLLAVLVVVSAALIPRSYFQFPVCDANISVSLVHRALASSVFGQHIAVELVADRLGELVNDNRRNLLVLSFQGWTGIGKNHMSNILAQFVQPTNVHRYIVTLHFASNSKLDTENWIRSEVTASCGIHLFVIDELDKASDLFVSSLQKSLHSAKEFLSSQLHTKAIVLLLSNTGSTTINAYTAQVLEKGVLRENIACDGLVDRLQTALQHTWYSEMLREGLIDQIVPFLPLEKLHVEKCAAAALLSRQVEAKDKIIAAVLDRLSYFPLSNSIFSTTGCRKVNAELDLVLY